MPADTDVEAWGEVVDVLPGGMFKVKIEPGENVALTYLSGKIRINSIKIVMGDRVQVALSPYDLTRGRIVRRMK